MSHTTAIKAIKVVSISALRNAVRELNENGTACELVENETPRAYFPNQTGMGLAPFVLKLRDAPYDIGFYLSEDGKTYEARTDFWGGSIEKVLGGRAGDPARKEQARLGKLYQMYAVHAATETARKAGHMTQRKVHPDGRITLTITGANL